jgi:hypothetical protein
MAGVKGRSGRRVRSVENKRLDDIDKCWEVTMAFIRSSAPIKERAEMASRIVVRSIPEEQKHSGSFDVFLKDVVNKSKAING